MKTKIDLNAARNVILNNPIPLLESLNIDYEDDRGTFFMRCPAHEGSDNPRGCSLSTQYKTWKCWTHDCQSEYGKDIFGFVKGALQTDNFGEVLSHLSKIYKFEKQGSAKVEPTKELEIQKINKHFKRQLVKDIKTVNFNFPTIGRSPYFEMRGFKPETLKFFGVEDCVTKGCPVYGRAVIPIKDDGLQVGYIARSTKQWIEPKFLIPKGFRKENYLYNIDNALRHALKTSCLFLVEGSGDVWKLHECGVYNCVAIMGRSVTLSQERRLLSSGVTTLVVLTDNDSSGREAKIDIKRKFSRFFSLLFPRLIKKDIGKMSCNEIHESILSGLKGLY